MLGSLRAVADRLGRVLARHPGWARAARAAWSRRPLDPLAGPCARCAGQDPSPTGLSVVVRAARTRLLDCHGAPRLFSPVRAAGSRPRPGGYARMYGQWSRPMATASAAVDRGHRGQEGLAFSGRHGHARLGQHAEILPQRPPLARSRAHPTSGPAGRAARLSQIGSLRRLPVDDDGPAATRGAELRRPWSIYALRAAGSVVGTRRTESSDDCRARRRGDLVLERRPDATGTGSGRCVRRRGWETCRSEPHRGVALRGRWVIRFRHVCPGTNSLELGPGLTCGWHPGSRGTNLTPWAGTRGGCGRGCSNARSRDCRATGGVLLR